MQSAAGKLNREGLVARAEPKGSSKKNSAPGVDEHAAAIASHGKIRRGAILCVGGQHVAVRLLRAGNLLFFGADFAGELLQPDP